MEKQGTQTIETERLLLRRFKIEDAGYMFGWAGDTEVTKHLRFETHKNIEETRQTLQSLFIENYEKPNYFCWAMQLKTTGEVLGSIGIMQEDGSWQPGYCIAKKHWGNGYTAEALKASIDFVFVALGISEMYCMHAEDNPESGRVMQKCGFVYLQETEYYKFDGSPVKAKKYILKR